MGHIHSRKNNYPKIKIDNSNFQCANQSWAYEHHNNSVPSSPTEKDNVQGIYFHVGAQRAALSESTALCEKTLKSVEFGYRYVYIHIC